jgi:hypothetical protein
MNWITRLFTRQAELEPEAYDAFAPPLFERVAPVSRDPSRPGFASSATALDRLTTSDSVDRLRGVYARAFTPSQPVASIERFAGRTDLLNRIIRAIEDQHLHVILYGDRGIGKTSILRVVSELAKSARYVVHYTSCGEESEFSATFRNVAAQIKLLYDGDIDPGMAEVERGGTLADRLPPGDFTVSQLSQVLETVSGTRVLLILDEFDRATSPKFRAATAELIKNLSDRSVRVQLLIAGVASNLTDLIAHIPSIRRNIVGISVPNMVAEEVRDMVTIAERSGGAPFDDAAVERLVTVSAGLPYIAALVGQHAIIAASEARALSVGIAQVDVARSRAAEDIFSRLPPRVQYMLSDGALFGPNTPIGRAAHEAISHDGSIADPALIATFTGNSADLAPLVEPVPDHPRGAWRFVEDGTSSYIWLAGQQG